LRLSSRIAANIDKLQRLQSTLATQSVTNTRRRDHITHCSTRRYALAAGALTDWVHRSHSRRSILVRTYPPLCRLLRSRGVNTLQNSPAVFNFSKRAFCHASPAVWNSLPRTV